MFKRLNEGYDAFDFDDVWDAYDVALEYLGAEELCESLAKAMGTDELEENLRYIFRNYDLNPDEDEEYDESLNRKNRRSMGEARKVREGYYDSDEEYAVNGHWLASATYADGTEVEREFPYTAENYREEQEEQYRLESWLLGYHPDCTWYSVSFVKDW